MNMPGEKMNQRTLDDICRKILEMLPHEGNGFGITEIVMGLHIVWDVERRSQPFPSPDEINECLQCLLDRALVRSGFHPFTPNDVKYWRVQQTKLCKKRPLCVNYFPLNLIIFLSRHGRA